MVEPIEVRRAVDFSELQDVFGRFMPYKLYIPICFCFPLQGDVSKDSVITRLSQALEKLAEAFPWLAGQITKDEKTDAPIIIPGEQKCGLIVKDFADDVSIPSMEDLQNARFPYSMLDGTIFTPLAQLPFTWTDPPAPVFLTQVNFIRGGLVVAFLGEHSVMDGPGFDLILQMLSRICHGQLLTDEEVLVGNCARLNIVPPYDQSNFEPDPRIRARLAPKPRSPYDESTKVAQGYFRFPAHGLSKLKELAGTASGSIPEKSTASYVTTNDALSAFVWKSITRIRASHLPPDASSLFVRAVDIRACLSIPRTYLGLIYHQTYSTTSVVSAVSAPLSHLASLLRSELNPSSLADDIRSITTVLKMTKNKSEIDIFPSFNRSTDIWLTSWTRLHCYHLDFNLGLGLPEAVKKPKHEIVEGLIHLMPMDRDGCVDASITLRADDLELLKTDKEWNTFAEWLG